jgi:hypothetical protein
MTEAPGESPSPGGFVYFRRFEPIMGRHETDPIPIRDLIRDSGPMKRIRHDDTQTIPAEETKRRTWPLALFLAVTLSAAVGVPVVLFRASADESPTFPLLVSTGTLSASPEPQAEPTTTATATITKNSIRYKTRVPAPAKTIYRTAAPVPGPTVFLTAPAKPGPTKTIKTTVTKTAKPAPGPTVTKTVFEDRCFELDADGNRMEIVC